jgi:hypothetical protein
MGLRRRKYQAEKLSGSCRANALRTTRSTCAVTTGPAGGNLPSILLPNICRKILDKVVGVDKGSAKVNAPLPLHGNYCQLLNISHYEERMLHFSL